MIRPMTVSISLLPTHLRTLKRLADARSRRCDPASRSALVRQALNVGLQSMLDAENLPLQDETESISQTGN